MRDLSILCVTAGCEYARPFRKDMSQLASELGAEMVFAADRCYDTLIVENLVGKIIEVESLGYMESVLDEGVTACERDYVLRLDDDERVSPAMREWLIADAYRHTDHWSFARFHMWPDLQHFVVSPPYFPDWQTRLSVKAKAGGRPKIHSASPWGLGTPAPCGLEHYELVVKTVEDRAAICQSYARTMGYTISDEESCNSQPERWKEPPNLLLYRGGRLKITEVQQ